MRASNRPIVTLTTNRPLLWSIAWSLLLGCSGNSSGTSVSSGGGPALVGGSSANGASSVGGPATTTSSSGGALQAIGGSTAAAVGSVGGNIGQSGGSPTSTPSGGHSSGGSSADAKGGNSTKGGSGNASVTSGGTANGGMANGGVTSGGAARGGTASGGTAAGGVGSMGSSNAAGRSHGGAGASGAPAGGASFGGAASGGTTTGTGGVLATGGTTPGTNTHSGKWQIMMLGDSITASTCYPQLLSKTLAAAGHSNFQFVGKATNNQSCNGAPNVLTEGHGNYLVTYLQSDSPKESGKGTLTELNSWAAEKPEVVVMHFGTNDVWNGIAVSTILAAYTNVLTRFRAQNPQVIFVVAQIIGMNVTNATCSGCSCPNCSTTIQSLNQQIPSWASTNGTTTSPIYVVDLNNGFDATQDTKDGVHPNPTGSQKMADRMSAGLVALNLGI